MYQLQFTLKQHTPIIHFQHDQDGATLRATEVKPKLDRYILEQLGKESKDYKTNEAYETTYDRGKDIANKNGWLIDKEGKKGALDYKMRIEAYGAPTYYWVSSNPDSKDKKLRDGTIKEGKDNTRIANAKINNSTYLNKTQYFADNQFIDKPYKEWINIHRGLKHDTKINLILKTFNSYIIKEIEKFLPAFFCLHNFGTRQSKGFGCFLPMKITVEDIEKSLIENEKVTGVFKLKLNDLNTEEKLQFIASKYSLLKMGRGAKAGGYEKSRLWIYLCEKKNISWEKRKIKIHVLEKDLTLFNTIYSDNATLKQSPLNSTKNNYDTEINHFYIRALLGLSEQFEFLLFNNYRSIDFKNKLQVKVSDELNFKTEEKFKKLAIDRFQSPIRFIVVDNFVFLVAYSIPKTLSEFIHPDTGKIELRKFQFKIDQMQKNKTFTLTVPSDFNVADFISTSNLFGNNLKSIKQ